MSCLPQVHKAAATALATLLFWTPLATTVARAQDIRSVQEAATQAVVDSSAARDLAVEASDLAREPSIAEKKARDSADVDWAARSLGDPAAPSADEGTTASTPDEASEPITPLALPSGPAKTAVTPQQISLPKGEGSIEGMGESFTPNLSSGTGTFAVPIALPAGRNGVNPSLSLSYSTAAGSGVVGIGWSLAAPFISRQTDKGLPRYRDDAAWSAREDRFMYNGGQELVPVNNTDMPAQQRPACRCC